MPRTSTTIEDHAPSVPPRPRAGKVPTLASLYGELGVHQRNNLWGWSGCNEVTNTVVFQIDVADMRLPTDIERGERVELVHEMTEGDHGVWRDLCIAQGRQLPEKRIGWRKMRGDLSFARAFNSRVRAIVFGRRTKHPDDGPKQCRDWRVLPNFGKVVAFDEASGTYKIVFFRT